MFSKLKSVMSPAEAAGKATGKIIKAQKESSVGGKKRALLRKMIERMKKSSY